MKRPIPGQTYRLQKTSSGGWCLHSFEKEDQFSSGDVKARAGETLTCLKLCKGTFRRSRKEIEVEYGIWMLSNGKVAFDRPVPQEVNGHEDNIMNALIEF